MSSLNVESLHLSAIVQFNAYIFVLKTTGGDGFWPYTWRQMPKSEYEAETFKADGQCNMIQLTKTSLSVYSHSHSCQGTNICYFSVLHRTGEIYWMKSETFSASAKINIRASDPEIKLRNKFWILWVIWFKSLAQIVHNMHDMGESHKNVLQSYFTPHFSSLHIYIYICITYVTGKKLRVCFWTITFFLVTFFTL